MDNEELCFFHCNRKQCITSESQFDFLKELVENIPDLPTNEEEADDLDEPKPKRYAGVKLEGGRCVCVWMGWWGGGGGTPKILKTPLAGQSKILYIHYREILPKVWWGID